MKFNVNERVAICNSKSVGYNGVVGTVVLIRGNRIYIKSDNGNIIPCVEEELVRQN